MPGHEADVVPPRPVEPEQLAWLPFPQGPDRPKLTATRAGGTVVHEQVNEILDVRLAVPDPGEVFRRKPARRVHGPPDRGELLPLGVWVEGLPDGGADQHPQVGHRVGVGAGGAENEVPGQAHDREQADGRGDADLSDGPQVGHDLADPQGPGVPAAPGRARPVGRSPPAGIGPGPAAPRPGGRPRGSARTRCRCRPSARAGGG